jgi:hypothetical protein
VPPRSINSRYALSLLRRRADGVALILKRTPFRFRQLPDTRTHVVSGADTLFSLAGQYFVPMDRASGFWWVIADFQPEPIVDPTRKLGSGRALYIPSINVLRSVILSESRRSEI